MPNLVVLRFMVPDKMIFNVFKCFSFIAIITRVFIGINFLETVLMRAMAESFLCSFIEI